MRVVAQHAEDAHQLVLPLEVFGRQQSDEQRAEDEGRVGGEEADGERARHQLVEEQEAELVLAAAEREAVAHPTRERRRRRGARRLLGPPVRHRREPPQYRLRSDAARRLEVDPIRRSVKRRERRGGLRRVAQRDRRRRRAALGDADGAHEHPPVVQRRRRVDVDHVEKMELLSDREAAERRDERRLSDVGGVLVAERPQLGGAEGAVRGAARHQSDLEAARVGVGVDVVRERAQLLEDLELLRRQRHIGDATRRCAEDGRVLTVEEAEEEEVEAGGERRRGEAEASDVHRVQVGGRVADRLEPRFVRAVEDDFGREDGGGERRARRQRRRRDEDAELAHLILEEQ